MRTMRVTSSFDIGQDPDVVDFDPQLHLLYVAGEAGIVSMFKADAGRGSRIGDGRIGLDAHVVGVDGSKHRAYFPLKNGRGQAILSIMESKG